MGKAGYALLWANGASFSEIYDLMEADIRGTFGALSPEPPTLDNWDGWHDDLPDIVLGRPVALSTPGACCGHTYNFHTNGGRQHDCSVCPCPAFEVR